jgi:hypothetical protein
LLFKKKIKKLSRTDRADSHPISRFDRPLRAVIEFFMYESRADKCRESGDVLVDIKSRQSQRTWLVGRKLVERKTLAARIEPGPLPVKRQRAGLDQLV